MNVLIVAATKLEITSDKISYLPILLTGVGMVNTAINLTKALNNNDYDLVINMGVAGCFLDEIKDCLQDTLNPIGVAVVIEAQHLCMQMRGVEKQHSSTTTSAFSGIFISDEKTRSEFINLIK